MSTTSPVGSHRVVSPAGTLPQAADRLDPNPEIAEDEVRIGVERLNLDAASFRQLRTAHGGDGAAVRAEVLDIIERRGKMHNPATGSGGMLIGTVEAVGPRSPLGLKTGQKVATLVSLTLTPLRITDGLARWDGLTEQVPAAGHAILFGRSIAAVLPEDLPEHLALAVLDVCGAPALVRRVVARRGPEPVKVAVLGAAGKSGSLALAAARDALTFDATSINHAPSGSASSDGASPGSAPSDGASSDSASSDRASSSNNAPGHDVVTSDAAVSSSATSSAVTTLAVVRDATEAARLRGTGLADRIAVADATDPLGLAQAVTAELGGGADVTVVCVDVPGCEHGAILATATGGTVVFFSMATSFPAAALGAEGLAADVEMLIGNGYVPGHADYALQLVRENPHLNDLFTARVGEAR